jgi:hypothetical protein
MGPLMVQALRIYLACLAVLAGLSALFMLYVCLRYGWTNALNAISSEDAKGWLAGLIVVPGVATGGYLLEKLLLRVWPGQRKE